jgi:hypothetical protein
MRDLFGSWRPTGSGRQYESTIPPLIDLPSRVNSEGTKSLVEQLVAWHPDAPKNQKTDTVMALWFAEIRARELTDEGFGKTHLDNPYLPPRLRERQMVVDLDTYYLESLTPDLGVL